MCIVLKQNSQCRWPWNPATAVSNINVQSGDAGNKTWISRHGTATQKQYAALLTCYLHISYMKVLKHSCSLLYVDFLYSQMHLLLPNIKMECLYDALRIIALLTGSTKQYQVLKPFFSFTPRRSVLLVVSSFPRYVAPWRS